MKVSQNAEDMHWYNELCILRLILTFTLRLTKSCRLRLLDRFCEHSAKILIYN